MRDWRLLTLVLLACLTGQDAYGDGQGTALVEMEGHSHVLDPLNWRESTTTFNGDDIRFYLTADGQPVSINFNLSNTGILSQGSAVYTLPDFNQSGSGTIELTFFNLARESGRMQRRIIFNQGEIVIRTLTTSRLSVEFKGTGNPLMRHDERIPIEGSIEISF